jgi:putative ABC transport system permease protein
MKWKKLIKAALRSIARNRMRSTLTMLGMIIGVGAVIALVSVGGGTQASVENEIASLGTNLLIITPGTGRVSGVSGGASSLNTLETDDVRALEDDATWLSGVSPVITSHRQVIAGNVNWPTTINGVDPAYLDITDWSVESGAFFTDRDVTSRSKVAVLGQTVADELFPNKDPIGSKIRIGNAPFTVIGVMSEKGQAMHGMDQDDVILAPSTTVLYRLTDGEAVSSIMASAVSSEAMEQAKDEVTTILRKEHRLDTDEADDFSVRLQTEIVERASSVTGMLTLLLGSVAGVSLLVGGIGIMNIMLVSVTERTREIGIRLAIGAREGDVMTQFLVEAVTLSSIGGVLGIAFGLGAGYLLGRMLGVGIAISPMIVVLSFLVSATVGVFFGLYPAKKASALDPILALHYE